MPFQDNNIASGLSQNDSFQVGVTDSDNDTILETGIGLPFPTNPAATYMYYDCVIECMLDSGLVIHNRLPQVNRTPDTLASINFDAADFQTNIVNGVNLKCNDQYQDILQRMGHSRYWFRLYGQALRVGYQVPIPSIKSIGGVPAVPYDRNRQWAFNRIFPGGNYGGVPLWHAAWSLWYTTLTPPKDNTFPAVDPVGGIYGTTPLPDKEIQVPWSQKDDETDSRSIDFVTIPR